MKKIRVSESELIDLIEKLVKENIGGNTGFNSKPEINIKI